MSKQKSDPESFQTGKRYIKFFFEDEYLGLRFG